MPDEDDPNKQRTVCTDASMEIEAGATVEGTSTFSAEVRVLRWPPITAETLAVAVVLGVIGFCLWQTEKYQGLGDNLITVTVVVFVVWGMEQLRKWLILRQWGHKVLRMMGLKQQEVP